MQFGVVVVLAVVLGVAPAVVLGVVPAVVLEVVLAVVLEVVLAVEVVSPWVDSEQEQQGVVETLIELAESIRATRKQEAKGRHQTVEVAGVEDTWEAVEAVASL